MQHGYHVPIQAIRCKQYALDKQMSQSANFPNFLQYFKSQRTKQLLYLFQRNCYSATYANQTKITLL